MNERQCGKLSGFGYTCQRLSGHEGKLGHAGVFWDGLNDLEAIKARANGARGPIFVTEPSAFPAKSLSDAVLELVSAYEESSKDTAFSEGYRDGCRAAARDFRTLIHFWETPQRIMQGIPTV